MTNPRLAARPREAVLARRGPVGSRLEQGWLPRPIRNERLVFPAPRGGLINLDNWRACVWSEAILASELAPRPLYQMRHTYASLALAAGADIYWVSRQMGRKDIRVTLKHYARFQRHSAVDARNLGVLNDFGIESGEGASEVRH